jgi:ribonuclease VapC
MPEPGSKHVVLDSFAILALLNDEPGASRVEELLRQSQDDDVYLAMSLINLGEVAYIVERLHGTAGVRSVLAFLDEVPLELYPADHGRVLSAAHIKAEHPLAFADAFAGALALELDATLLTGDPEFQTLDDKVAIEWVA